ncbi:MAG TPA: hypothetical protein VGG14_16570 [Candidatus Sulfotelmatobacter sp.]|jgi:hypothetical protein
MSELKRCTVGYLQEGNGRYSVIIDHVFADGRVLFKDMDVKRSYGVTTTDVFIPSRDAYVSLGSFVEPIWDGDSCRCLNYWAEENVNVPQNVRTDAEGWEFANRMTA